jgi:hypothetical protein
MEKGSLKEAWKKHWFDFLLGILLVCFLLRTGDFNLLFIGLITFSLVYSLTKK